MLILTDEELMYRVQQDDTDAFALLYDRHSLLALRVARAVIGDHGRAQDAVQEAFLSIWRSRTSFNASGGSFRGWAMTVVQRRAIDMLRRSANAATDATLDDLSERAIAGEERPTADLAVARADGARLRETILDLLPGPQREAIVLAFFGELTHAEIADRLKLPQGTVKGRIRLGLEKLRESVETQASFA